MTVMISWSPRAVAGNSLPRKYTEGGATDSSLEAILAQIHHFMEARSRVAAERPSLPEES